jgi:hypothetical protein
MADYKWNLRTRALLKEGEKNEARVFSLGEHGVLTVLSEGTARALVVQQGMWQIGLLPPCRRGRATRYPCRHSGMPSCIQPYIHTK